MNRGASKAWALGVALLICTAPSFASGLDQKGTPLSSVSALNTYGMDVPTRIGLKAIVPKGWQLFIHKSANVPERLSWKVSDTWLSVLASLTQDDSLSVLVDWESQTVLIRTRGVALEEQATRAEISQAATTPLPRFGLKEKGSSPSEAVAVAAPVKVDEAVASPPSNQPAQIELPVVTKDTTPQLQRTEPVLATARPLESTTDFTYNEAFALNKPEAKRVAAGIAHKYGYRLVWLSSGFKLDNPVTLLAASVAQDVALLQKAMGVYSPVVLEIDENKKTLLAVDRALTGVSKVQPQVLQVKTMQVLQPPDVPAPVIRPVQAEPAVEKQEATQLDTKEVSKSVDTKPLPESSASQEAPKLALAMHKGESLEEAISKFASSLGYTLEWRIKGGFESNRDIAFTGTTMAQILTQVLPPLGVSADIYTQNKHLIIRPGLRSGR